MKGRQGTVAGPWARAVLVAATPLIACASASTAPTARAVAVRDDDDTLAYRDEFLRVARDGIAASRLRHQADVAAWAEVAVGGAAAATTQLSPESPINEAYKLTIAPLPHGTWLFVLIYKDYEHPARLSFRGLQDGSEDFPDGKLDRTLTSDEWAGLKVAIEASGFWRGAQFTEERGVLDGTGFTIDGKDGTEYRSTTGFNPLDCPLSTLSSYIYGLAE
jgi:hypothetical protein